MALAFSLMLSEGLAFEDGFQAVIVLGDLVWTARDNGEEMTWHRAHQFCQEGDWNGRRDWRLPTVAELSSLYDPGKTAAVRAIESRGVVNQYPVHMDSSFRPSQVWYWSGQSSGQGRARNFDFFTGLAGTFSKDFSTASGAFCVRRAEDRP